MFERIERCISFSLINQAMAVLHSTNYDSNEH